MGIHWMIFLTIGNLVSPSSFPFAGQVKDRLARALRTKDLSGLGLLGKAGPSSRRVCCLAGVTYETRCLLIGGAAIRKGTNGRGGPRFFWARRRVGAQLFFGSHP